MLDNTATFTATTMVCGGKEYKLNETIFYCLEQKDLEFLADHLFVKAYHKLENVLFFSLSLGIFIGMLVMSLIAR